MDNLIFGEEGLLLKGGAVPAVCGGHMHQHSTLTPRVLKLLLCLIKLKSRPYLQWGIQSLQLRLRVTKPLTLHYQLTRMLLQLLWIMRLFHRYFWILFKAVPISSRLEACCLIFSTIWKTIWFLARPLVPSHYHIAGFTID